MKLLEEDQTQSLNIASSSLQSYTSQIQVIRIMNHPDYKNRIVIVDTPGFDDTHKSDMEILKIIGQWLEQAYKGQVLLRGIFYLHRISDNRMAGSPRKNLEMFKKLTGQAAANRVVLVTTMWDLARTDERRETFTRRQQQLSELYWRDLLAAGARYEAFDNSHEAALRCIKQIFPLYKMPLIPMIRPSTPLQIQDELVNVGKRINETDAGRTLYSSLQDTLDQTRKTLQTLREQAMAADDHEAVSRLERELRVTEAQFQRTFVDLRELEIPWWRKVLLIVLPKGGQRPPRRFGLRWWIQRIIVRPRLPEMVTEGRNLTTGGRCTAANYEPSDI
ncbi:hypothetical protein CVT24_003922 [Panaeolus cyanescens]|uniref:G domain-containing protein n=1 Tax=Panaeolus cyanescens TaxID=181874 RepID=A0A409YXF9_9AGAR|nr:hypothetical protein CVT24_003922 [Panaeolus cyanescens]